MTKQFTPEEIAKTLYQSEINMVRAERKVPAETDPKKQIEYLEKLAESIKELEVVNGDLPQK